MRDAAEQRRPQEVGQHIEMMMEKRKRIRLKENFRGNQVSIRTGLLESVDSHEDVKNVKSFKHRERSSFV